MKKKKQIFIEHGQSAKRVFSFDFVIYTAHRDLAHGLAVQETRVHDCVGVNVNISDIANICLARER